MVTSSVLFFIVWFTKFPDNLGFIRVYFSEKAIINDQIRLKIVFVSDYSQMNWRGGDKNPYFLKVKYIYKKVISKNCPKS